MPEWALTDRERLTWVGNFESGNHQTEQYKKKFKVFFRWKKYSIQKRFVNTKWNLFRVLTAVGVRSSNQSTRSICLPLSHALITIKTNAVRKWQKLFVCACVLCVFPSTFASAKLILSVGNMKCSSLVQQQQQQQWSEQTRGKSSVTSSLRQRFGCVCAHMHTTHKHNLDIDAPNIGRTTEWHLIVVSVWVFFFFH